MTTASKPVVIDGILRNWGEQYNLNEGAKKGRKAKNGRGSFGGGGGGADKGRASASAARAALEGIAKKSPQAIVKISGGGKGSKAIAAHLTYISRHGELNVEDQDGQGYQGKGATKEIIEQWESGGSPVPVQGEYREAFNIVLSSQTGTDPKALLQAVRDFASEQFGDEHEYVMALHEPGSDPSATKSENPHVHLVVKARGRDGKKLNPRKADLHNYRQAYARHLRANGIDAIAVKRQALFQQDKGVPQSVHQLKKRGVQPNAKPIKPNERALKRALANEAAAKALYGDVVAALAKSEIADDRALAKGLKAALPALGPQLTETTKRRR